MMKDAWAASGISKLEAYGKKTPTNGKNSTSAYIFASLYILFWKSRIRVMQLERLSSFN